MEFTIIILSFLPDRVLIPIEDTDTVKQMNVNICIIERYSYKIYWYSWM